MTCSHTSQAKDAPSYTPLKSSMMFSPFPISSTKYFHLGISQFSESNVSFLHSPTPYIDPLIQTREEIRSLNETFKKLVNISIKKRNIKEMHKSESSSKTLKTPNKSGNLQVKNKEGNTNKSTDSTNKSPIENKLAEKDKINSKDKVECTEFQIIEELDIKDGRKIRDPNKVPKRRKRKSLDQMKILMEEFNKNPSWPKNKMGEVSAKVGLSEAQVYKCGWDQKRKKSTE